MTGWIKLHRKIIEHWIWSDPIKFQWWLLMLMNVNHTEQKIVIGYNIFLIKRGQSGKSLRTWAALFGVGTKAVINFFELLEKDEMIIKETIGKGKHSSTLITITNYDTFQSNEETLSATLSTTLSTTLEKREGHTNNNDKELIKNEKNDKEKNSRFSPPSLSDVQQFIFEKKFLTVDANAFWNFYESKNWMVGKNKMKDWQRAAGGWEARNKTKIPVKSPGPKQAYKFDAARIIETNTRDQKQAYKFDIDEIEAQINNK